MGVLGSGLIKDAPVVLVVRVSDVSVDGVVGRRVCVISHTVFRMTSCLCDGGFFVVAYGVIIFLISCFESFITDVVISGVCAEMDVVLD